MQSQQSFQVAVIGAGTMGSGIAAHLANLGFQVTLFDMNRASCQAAFDRALSVKPPHFYSRETQSRIRIAGIHEDIELVRDADWVCEAIIEKLEAKQSLYAQIQGMIRPDAMVSTNTSGLQIGLLTQGLESDFKRRFLGTHFFNPPRYLKLLELIPTPDTERSEIEKVTKFLEEHSGRRVVLAKDTPGFIANRFGMWAMIHAVHVAEKLRLSIESVDAMTGPFLGRPRSASFRLNDLVGLDIMADIAGNLAERCAVDQWHENLTLPRSVQHLLSVGSLGQKTGHGYYRKEGKSLSALNLETLLYEDLVGPDIAGLKEISKKPLGERVRLALESNGDLGEFMRRHLIPVFQYADSIRAEVSHTVQDFDRVMMWGFGWEMGPFAMMDAIGHDLLGIQGGPFYDHGKQRAHGGGWQPIRQEPEYRSLDAFPVVETRSNFLVRDLGDSVVAVDLTTRLGVITPSLVEELTNWVEAQNGPFVLANSQRFFSVGFDLNYFLHAAETNDLLDVDVKLSALQHLADLLSTKRAVAVAHGYCLGAGFELATGCPVILAHPEAQIGLPEIKVGLFPGGGGTTRLALRGQSSAKHLAEAFATLVDGTVSSCAADARAKGLLRETDVIGDHPDRLITDAKAMALNVRPNLPTEWTIPGGPLLAMLDTVVSDGLKAGRLSGHDVVIADKIKLVLAKANTWDDALAQERKGFDDLLRHGLTIARIKHMLENNTPLRN